MSFQITPVLIGKIVPLLFFLIATVLGCQAHIKSVFVFIGSLKAHDLAEEGISWDHFDKACDDHNKNKYSDIKLKDSPECPEYAHALEGLFVTITVFGFMFAAVNVIASFLKDLTPYKKMDAIFHLVMGILTLLSACMIIGAAVVVDDFSHGYYKFNHEVDKSEKAKDSNLSLYRTGYRYTVKLVSGVLGILAGIGYFAAAFFIQFGQVDQKNMPKMFNSKDDKDKGQGKAGVESGPVPSAEVASALSTNQPSVETNPPHPIESTDQ